MENQWEQKLYFLTGLALQAVGTCINTGYRSPDNIQGRGFFSFLKSWEEEMYCRTRWWNWGIALSYLVINCTQTDSCRLSDYICHDWLNQEQADICSQIFSFALVSSVQSANVAFSVQTIITMQRKKNEIRKDESKKEKIISINHVPPTDDSCSHLTLISLEMA